MPVVSQMYKRKRDKVFSCEYIIYFVFACSFPGLSIRHKAVKLHCPSQPQRELQTAAIDHTHSASPVTLSPSPHPPAPTT